MVEVKVGTVIKDGFREGSSSKGPWACAEVKAEQGYDKIKVWAENPNDIAGAMVITEILSVKITNHKYPAKDGSEKWATDYNVQAKLAKADGTPAGFEKLDDDNIPF